MINVNIYTFCYLFCVLDILLLETLDNGPAGLKHVADLLKTMGRLPK